MFFGTFTPKLDDKGRIFLPAKFRDAMAEGLVVARGQENSLSVWSKAGFDQETERLQRASLMDKATRDYVRMLFAGAFDDVPDKQGRVTIPPMLREYASLERDVVVVGAMSRLEIWNPEAWATYTSEQVPRFSALDADLVPGT
ncbi:division/cell wall cluster transcriptional repressor MraZ [Nocardioides sp. ChNu-153]|uniref:division/cell wall cluster transcriptional repressor MraZ n=1 Tax=Nocardioides sp. CPCC 205120 TaxID=3406462 RepID=UPI0024076BED|nr:MULTISPECIES: division/cell wall cluster transcriptional repressor MraZ [unclassified Nocardioides]MDF9716548.1 division/cell wall cluster transcriptional repressor MraZ [Nocardioides sp. ChNu-99]MDN7120889.1 division/cell wall cluster transcriptional repressor MraZ [Nocardioides sp. ChNu-153]